MSTAFALLSLLLLQGCSGDPPIHVRYLVLGAGPGGLQIGHYLESAGRDYLILEASQRAGSFFSTYPRWRQLISINKREVGRNDSLAFAERHDWNSLLSGPSHAQPSALPSTTDARLTPASIGAALRLDSPDYYPRAETLSDYLQQWAAAPRNGTDAGAAGLGRAAPLAVRYGVTVTRISRAPPGAPGAPRFALTATSATGVSPLHFTCVYLLLATGLQALVPPPSQNFSAAVSAGLVHTYASAPASPEAYRGKRVLVLGHGNAAWEFAQHTLGVASYVHVAGRPTSRVKLALETHYPGNVRAVHAGLLETYNLKSLDGITAVPFERLTFAAAPGGGIAVALARPATCTHDAHGRATSRCPLRHAYDMVVACLGWRFDGSLFDEGVRPALAPNGKHPAATARYESTNVPGLFLVGTLAHAVDHKKASGGFIHGFRYTARALHRMLEEEEAEAALAAAAQQVAPEGGNGAAALPFARWPVTRTRTLRALHALLIRRMNSAAGTFQMFGQLADVFVLDPLPPHDPSLARVASPHAPMEHPWHFFDAEAAAAAAAGTDPSGIAGDVAALQALPPPSTPPRAPHALHSERAINAALAGGLREEVPLGHAATAALAWAKAQHTSSPPHPPPPPLAEWLELTLEFGPSPPPGHKDPFALDRTDAGTLEHPERSHFLHPVLRYRVQGSAGAIAELHLVEDFHAQFDLHTAHHLPLSRFLQHLGLLRARGRSQASAAQAQGSAPQPWPAPRRPPTFLWGMLTQLMSACQGATALHWGGAAFAAGAEADGWWLKMSMGAEASLEGLVALGVHALDPAPGVALGAGEAAHTRAVRARWGAFAAREEAAQQAGAGSSSGGRGGAAARAAAAAEAEALAEAAETEAEALPPAPPPALPRAHAQP